MKTTAKLEQTDVERALSAGLGEAVRNGWTVSVAVVDAGGHLLGFMRRDGAIPASVEVALAKARTAATFNAPTGVLEDRIAERPGMMILPGATALRGGLPLVAEGSPVGGIGVSGGTPQQDEQIAKAGADALG
ncbi:MAG: GlcG/HbpS family heme-binding protein [bacterium]